MRVLLGQGDGSLRSGPSYAVGAEPQSVVVADFNIDGNLDVAVAAYAGQEVDVLAGQGDGSFRAWAGHPLRG